MTQTTFRWEQDGSGGEHGTATYFPGQHNETKVQMPSFKAAHEFQIRIDNAISEARYDGRANLMMQIMRIKL